MDVFEEMAEAVYSNYGQEEEEEEQEIDELLEIRLLAL